MKKTFFIVLISYLFISPLFSWGIWDEPEEPEELQQATSWTLSGSGQSIGNYYIAQSNNNTSYNETTYLDYSVSRSSASSVSIDFNTGFTGDLPYIRCDLEVQTGISHTSGYSQTWEWHEPIPPRRKGYLFVRWRYTEFSVFGDVIGTIKRADSPDSFYSNYPLWTQDNETGVSVSSFPGF